MGQSQHKPLRSTFSLFVTGTSSTPGNIDAVQRKQENGKADSYLAGLDYDLSTMKRYICKTYGGGFFNALRDAKGLTRQTVLKNVRDLMQRCNENDAEAAFLYYTGHGEQNT